MESRTVKLARISGEIGLVEKVLSLGEVVNVRIGKAKSAQPMVFEGEIHGELAFMARGNDSTISSYRSAEQHLWLDKGHAGIPDKPAAPDTILLDPRAARYSFYTPNMDCYAEKDGLLKAAGL